MSVPLLIEPEIQQCAAMDEEALADVRTGLVAAIALKDLAQGKIDTAGVIGSGVQSRYQMHALKLVQDSKRLMVKGTNLGEVARFAADMADDLDIQVIQADSPEAVVRASEVVVTTTRAGPNHPG
jgi:ornithine cyclodeaminase/alanine dehydrogenase-like protein (mu-crystallin family)